FPIDKESLTYLRLSGRSEEQIALVETYARAQGMWRESGQPEASYSAVLSLDMSQVRPSMAGPKRPQDRVLLEDVKANFNKHVGGLSSARTERGGDAHGRTAICMDGTNCTLEDGAVVIAAITSC